MGLALGETVKHVTQIMGCGQLSKDMLDFPMLSRLTQLQSQLERLGKPLFHGFAIWSWCFWMFLVYSITVCADDKKRGRKILGELGRDWATSKSFHAPGHARALDAINFHWGCNMLSHAQWQSRKGTMAVMGGSRWSQIRLWQQWPYRLQGFSTPFVCPTCPTCPTWAFVFFLHREWCVLVGPSTPASIQDPTKQLFRHSLLLRPFLGGTMKHSHWRAVDFWGWGTQMGTE